MIQSINMKMLIIIFSQAKIHNKRINSLNWKWPFIPKRIFLWIMKWSDFCFIVFLLVQLRNCSSRLSISIKTVLVNIEKTAVQWNYDNFPTISSDTNHCLLLQLFQGNFFYIWFFNSFKESKLFNFIKSLQKS